MAKDQALARRDTATLPGKERKTGRGERGCPATNDLPITMRLSQPPEPMDWLESA